MEIFYTDGNIVVKYRYDAWGNHKVFILQAGEFFDISKMEVYNMEGEANRLIANLNPIRYRSYYFDTETGLYYLQSRYYDPEIGRFLNADGIANLDPETINGLNLYAYCGNNSVMNVDPDGHAFFSFLIALAISSLVMWGVSQAVGSQIAGGIGSVANGGGAIYTGIGLLAFGPVGWVLGGALILVGAATVAMGVNEIVAGATGTNYLQQWTGMSDGLYNGLNIGLNIASGVGQIAGNVGMRIASNRILNNLVRNPTNIQNYKLWQIKTYGRYTSQFKPGVMQRSQSNPGGGYTLTHINGASEGFIMYHPGNSTWHTLKNPYFKISSNYVQGKTWYDIILKIFFKP